MAVTTLDPIPLPKMITMGQRWQRWGAVENHSIGIKHFFQRLEPEKKNGDYNGGKRPNDEADPCSKKVMRV